MPYIEQKRREILDVRPYEASQAGELNYLLTKELLRGNGDGQLLDRLLYRADAYLDDRSPMSYQRINDVIGALECAHREFSRRRGWFGAIMTAVEDAQGDIYDRYAVAYEDQKIAENGDVY